MVQHAIPAITTKSGQTHRETRSVLPLRVSARKVADGAHTGAPQSSSQFCRWGVRSVDLGRAKTVPCGWNLEHSLSKHDLVTCLAPTPKAQATSKASKTERRSIA